MLFSHRALVLDLVLVLVPELVRALVLVLERLLLVVLVRLPVRMLVPVLNRAKKPPTPKTIVGRKRSTRNPPSDCRKKPR